MTDVKIAARTQKIIVNPATRSVSVINAGPQGPHGIQGAIGPRNFQFVSDTPPTAITPGDQWFNSLNGREYVWYDGFWVEIGTSFQGSFLTVDGNLATRAAGVAAEITRANLAADVAFTAKYTQVINHGATAGTARVGTAPAFWIGSVNPTNAVDNDRLYRTDTTAYYIRISSAWVESGSSRFVPIATGPLGTLGVHSLVAPFATTGTHTTLQDEGLTLTLTPTAGRRWKFILNLNLYVPGGTNTISIRLLGGATVLHDFTIPSGSLSTTTAFSVALVHTQIMTATGSTIYKVQIAGVNNSAVNSYASAPSPRQLIIEDMGV